MKKANKIFHLEQFLSQNDFKNCKNHKKKKIKILFLMIIITAKVKGNPKGIFYIINYTCSAFVNRLNYTIQTEIESNRLQNVSKELFQICV